MEKIFDFDTYSLFEANGTICGFKTNDKSYSGWEDMYAGQAAMTLKKFGVTTDAEINALIRIMMSFKDVGEFLLTDYKSQLPEIAAFSLVLFDRIVGAEKYGFTFEEVFVMHEGLQECYGYLIEGEERQYLARKAANIRHAENRSMKESVLRWCDAHLNDFKSMDAAAEAIAGKLVPIKFRTAREWIGEWKKSQSKNLNDEQSAK